jgi:hypothetical protein
MIKEKEIPNLFKFSVLILGSGNFIQPLPLPSPLFSLPHGKKDVNKYHEGKGEHVLCFYNTFIFHILCGQEGCV